MKAVRYSHDDFAWKLVGHLLEDFKPFVEESFYDTVAPLISARNIVGFRTLSFGLIDSLSPMRLKTQRQLLEIFKKFSFSQDSMTPEEVLEDSKKKFLDNQKRLESFTINETDIVKDVLFRARGHIDFILGDFSKFDVLSRAKFGKKSSVGIPMKLACEGQRYEAPITGSSDQIVWFDKLYSLWNKPAYLYASHRAVNREVPLYRPIDTLEAVLVDKTWKAKRLIMPNTTLGTLYSGGLGVLIEDRLREHGYDIRHLQDVHGELARFGSITGSLVTADQSMASDNITVSLIDRIFPRPWASALKLGRISKINFYGHSFESLTFSTMGIGFTFPLQTLVFLGLLLGIRDHLGLDDSHVVSVFGDDLIYDSQMHDLTVHVFESCGLVINKDKTFHEGFFRESCGRDFFRGVDVRPFHLARVDGRDAGKRRFEAYLYKTINGLRRRWSDYEVPGTLTYLLNLVSDVRAMKPLTVPSDFPDTSGIKTPLSYLPELGDLAIPRRNFHGVVEFRYLAFEPDYRKEARHEPYYWLALRSHSQFDSLAYLALSKVKSKGLCGDILAEKPKVFTLDLSCEDTRSYRSKQTGKRHRIGTTMISEQDRGRYRERLGVTGNWTPKHR